MKDFISAMSEIDGARRYPQYHIESSLVATWSTNSQQFPENTPIFTMLYRGLPNANY